jgi:integrase
MTDLRLTILARPALRSLLAALPDYLRPILTIGYHTAMRSGEIRDIKWSQVDFLNNVIRLDADQTKGNTARQIPIFGELKKALLAQQARRQPDCPYVCFRIDRTGQAVPIGDFRKVWQDRCVKLGLGKWAQAIDSNGQPKFEKRRDHAPSQNRKWSTRDFWCTICGDRASEIWHVLA